jgi:hypothetical protein
MVGRVAMSTKLIDITKQLHGFLSSSAATCTLRETNGISGDAIIEAHVQKRRLSADRFGLLPLQDPAPADSNCLNIVNVAVAERNRRKGLCTDLLELLESFDYGRYRAPGHDFHIRVDNVMNPILDQFLPNQGYTPLRSGNSGHFSYLKTLPSSPPLEAELLEAASHMLAPCPAP